MHDAFKIETNDECYFVILLRINNRLITLDTIQEQNIFSVMEHSVLPIHVLCSSVCILLSNMKRCQYMFIAIVLHLSIADFVMYIYIAVMIVSFYKILCTMYICQL